jgi:hypothetical protein
MKKEILHYRKKELEKVKTFDETYKPIIKIWTDKNQTNCLSISKKELKDIVKLLTN